MRNDNLVYVLASCTYTNKIKLIKLSTHKLCSFFVLGQYVLRVVLKCGFTQILYMISVCMVLIDQLLVASCANLVPLMNGPVNVCFSNQSYPWRCSFAGPRFFLGHGFFGCSCLRSVLSPIRYILLLCLPTVDISSYSLGIGWGLFDFCERLCVVVESLIIYLLPTYSPVLTYHKYFCLRSRCCLTVVWFWWEVVSGS
jgi:hypothetical protein